MVEMIELARRFELQVKAIRTAQEDGAAAARLLRMG
jgi:flagellar basal body rod protein FlgF